MRIPQELLVALPTEGVDRNALAGGVGLPVARVALPTEGVDRNEDAGGFALLAVRVALPTEGVDRNCEYMLLGFVGMVALPTEGVDRNWTDISSGGEFFGRPPHGWRG